MASMLEKVLEKEVVRVDVIARAPAESGCGAGRPECDGCKRVFDIILSFLMLVPALPLIGICLFLVRLTSSGPGLYRQTRVGRRGRLYGILKIRTMYHNCEGHSGPKWSQAGDPRVTLLGRFLRKTHLDELPQLWNVLRGDMSLVGPRPERPEFIPALAQAIPRYYERLNVRPGVTGLAQVQLPPDTDLNSVRRKLVYDLYYAQHQSLGLDLRLIVATAGKMLGLPFGLTKMVLRLPSGLVVENTKTNPAAITPRVTELTPALQNV